MIKHVWLWNGKGFTGIQIVIRDEGIPSGVTLLGTIYPDGEVYPRSSVIERVGNIHPTSSVTDEILNFAKGLGADEVFVERIESGKYKGFLQYIKKTTFEQVNKGIPADKFPTLSEVMDEIV